MKRRYFDLLAPQYDYAQLVWKRFATCKRSVRGAVFSAVFLSFTLLLASCVEKPSGRLQIANDLMMTVAKSTPVPQSAIPISITSTSEFEKAILRAVEASEKYRAVVALEQGIIAEIGIAESVGRWQVSGTSTVGSVNEQGGTRPSNTTTGIAGGIQASKLIYDGGESIANVNSATAKAVGARLERIITGNELAREIAGAWIEVWQYEAKRDLLKARTIELEKVVSQIERMTLNGMMDRAILDSVLGKVVSISMDQSLLESKLSQARLKFARFFNEEPAELITPTGPVNLSDARAQLDNLQGVPEVQRIAVELIVAQNAVSAAKAAFEPKAKFQGGVTSPIQAGESTDISFGLALEYAFSDGGRRESQVNVAEAYVESVATNLLDTKRSLKMEIETAVQQLELIEMSLPLIARQIKLSASAAETAKSQLATGQANLSQIIDAKIEHYRAEDRQITMSAERLSLQFLIASRTGLLGELIGLPTDIAE